MSPLPRGSATGAPLLSQILFLSSATIVLVLGTIHLVYTFASNKFSPREPQLEQRMREVSPILTRQTTMWAAWVGFNASHSLGAMLFGLVYGYLAGFHLPFLLQSRFLVGLGALFLLSLLVLAKRYWFRIPLLGVALSLALYVAGISAACT